MIKKGDKVKLNSSVENFDKGDTAIVERQENLDYFGPTVFLEINDRGETEAVSLFSVSKVNKDKD